MIICRRGIHSIAYSWKVNGQEVSSMSTLFITLLITTRVKTLTVTKLCKGDMSQNSKMTKMVLGAILSHVEFQTGPYKTSHSKYLKNIQ